MPEEASRDSATSGAASDARLPFAGFVTLSTFGLIRFAGDDAQAYLQGQLSCDVNALQAGQAVYGSYSTPKGRMLATFLLWRDDTGYTMQLPRSIYESTRKRLSMYILRSKVSARDISDDYALTGLAGPDAEAQLAALFKAIPRDALTMTGGNGADLLRLDADRFLIIAHQARAVEIRKALAAHLTLASETAWDAANIHAGIPYITPPTQEQFVPQMANLDLINGVSFTKGCYPGQEIVARMHYLGKLKQRMYLATVAVDDVPKAGDKLYSADTGEQATGMIMNAAPASSGSFSVLAVMHIKSFEGGAVHLNSANGPRLEFTNLPYQIPS